MTRGAVAERKDIDAPGSCEPAPVSAAPGSPTMVSSSSRLLRESPREFRWLMTALRTFPREGSCGGGGREQEEQRAQQGTTSTIKWQPWLLWCGFGSEMCQKKNCHPVPPFFARVVASSFHLEGPGRPLAFTHPFRVSITYTIIT